MSGKEAAPPQVRSTNSFTVTSGDCMDDILQDSSQWQDDTESDSNEETQSGKIGMSDSSPSQWKPADTAS